MSMRETSAEIEAAAADWAVRVDDGAFDMAAQAALDAWIADDSRRLGAFARARAVLVHAKRAKALGLTIDHAAQPTPLRPPSLQPTAARRPTVSRRRMLHLGAAGAAAAAGVGTLAFGLQAAARTYSTGRGEIRLIPLQDGSSVTLNTQSRIRVVFSPKRRCVDVLSGEALFEVVDDLARPLEVNAGATCIRATGSSFTVTKLPAQPVRVMVRNGVVDIRDARRPASQGRLVAANTVVALAAGEPARQEVLRPGELNRQLAWREGMLSFEDETLARATQEFARYSDTRIIIADPQIASETVTGLYAANNPSGFAEAVAMSLGLHARMTDSGVILSR